MPHKRKPKVKKRKLLHASNFQGTAVGPTLRNPTAAIHLPGRLFAKTRKPAAP